MHFFAVETSFLLCNEMQYNSMQMLRNAYSRLEPWGGQWLVPLCNPIDIDSQCSPPFNDDDDVVWYMASLSFQFLMTTMMLILYDDV